MGGGGLDSQLWHACAGGMVQLPTVGARVIYFPQGHGEQAATTPEFPRSLGPAGTVICRVTSVLYLADTETDEVYARLMLQPEGSAVMAVEEEQQQQLASHEKPASFAKTLTQSDANNGGGFSVPRYCAETIFPPLDYSVDPPVQTVLAKDVHGETWKFRHIYRGTPRRHLLTTGWSAFVNQKKLVAGDAIVFLRSAGGEAPGDLCVGVRRSMRGAAGGAGDRESWHSGNGGAGRGLPRWEVRGAENLNFGDFLGGENAGGGRGGHGANSVSSFARNRARVTARSVLEAASLAVAGHPFEVVYYPRASTAEFCVKAGSVKAALEQRWYSGMRFKMAFETEDSSRISWFMGTISAVQPADPVLWPNSPWRVLQVTWDEPDLLQGVSRVSPWQVELVSTLPMQLPPFGLVKKNARILDYPLQAQAAVMAVPMAALATSALGQWHGLVEDVSAGMQEARQERIDGQALFRAKRAQAAILLNPYYRQDQGGVPNHGLSLYTAASTALQQQNGSRVSGKMTSFIGVGSTSQGSPAGNGSSTRRAPFVLFGQAIDLTDKVRAAVNPKQLDSGDGSYDEQSAHTWTTDSEQARGSAPYEGVNKIEAESLLQLSPGNAVKDGSCGESRSLVPKWLREQDLPVFGDALEKSVIDSFSHCKVFKDTEEVGRTVDLAIFSDYDELFGRLASMFCMDKMELQQNLVYRNAEGSMFQVGYEPYRNFMQSVRRLTILPNAATCCAAPS